MQETSTNEKLTYLRLKYSVPDYETGKPEIRFEALKRIPSRILINTGLLDRVDKTNSLYNWSSLALADSNIVYGILLNYMNEHPTQL